MTDINQIIESSVGQSVSTTPGAGVDGTLSPLMFLTRAGYLMNPWWSPARDRQLRDFWKQSDHLSGAIYTMQSKMTSIDFRVEPRDSSVKRHAVEAEAWTEILRDSAQYGEGWVQFFSKWIEDFLTQDNGAFAEIIGYGPKDGPLIGPPISIAHLDSAHCQRTGNSEYPVVYVDADGKRHKLHFTRVMYSAQMSSPIEEMFGVGFCGVSRCINVAQTLVDILTYKQEKLGSRPHRMVMITKGGLDPADVTSAFELAESDMHAQNLSRYSKVVVIGSSSLQDAGIDTIELSRLPDGFDERDSILLGMATIALALGMDARELFPAMQTGATRAEAMIQHLKQRGKGPGQILQTVESLFNFKVMPSRLRLVFDFQDDAQDRQVADIRKVRADARVQDMDSGAVTKRIIREKMLEEGDITRSQFERLELEDGRLPDGTSVLTLFYSDDKRIKELLDIGVSDPLDTEANDFEAVMQIVLEKISELSALIVNERSDARKLIYLQAMSAIKFLKRYYENPEILFGSVQDQGNNPDPIAGQRPVEDRVRTDDDANPTDNDRSGKRSTDNNDADMVDDQPE